ncbi:MAG: GxxExxY protein [Caldilineaceae bacterium]|nr:GxxExxY protein [Caldilineaceae bacterium]
MVLQQAELTDQIINVYYTVYNALGYGFLEKVYETAMLQEFERRGLQVEQQRNIEVYFSGKLVGDYYADLVVENRVILEIKAAEIMHDSFVAQLQNYLRATSCEIGFVFNFGKKPEFERRMFSNRRKIHLQS